MQRHCIWHKGYFYMKSLALHMGSKSYVNMLIWLWQSVLKKTATINPLQRIFLLTHCLKTKLPVLISIKMLDPLVHTFTQSPRQKMYFLKMEFVSLVLFSLLLACHSVRPCVQGISNQHLSFLLIIRKLTQCSLRI